MVREIEAEIGYIAPMTARPLSYSGYPDRENLVLDNRMMRIVNANTRTERPAFETHGFEATFHRSAIHAFDQSGIWHDTFKNEVIEVLKSRTGARDVVIPAVAYRSTALSGSFGAARFCHNDYTPGSTAIHIRNLDPKMADERLAGRYAAIQVWKLISDAPQDQPLALCDARSVSAADIVVGEAWYGEPKTPVLWGDMACVRHNPRHEWSYFPELQKDELLIWAGYDSNPEQPSIVPHTAVADPRVAPGGPPRINVEARCYAFF